MPEPLWAEFDRLAGDLRGGQVKWIVASAALLSLLKLTSAEQRRLFQEVMGADAFEDGFDQLVTGLRPPDSEKPKRPIDSGGIPLKRQAAKKKPG